MAKMDTQVKKEALEEVSTAGWYFQTNCNGHTEGVGLWGGMQCNPVIT